MVLKVPRARDGSFNPVLLNVLRNEDEERRKLIFSLYRRGLTTEQVSVFMKRFMAKTIVELQIKVETFYATNFFFDLLSASISFGVLYPIVEWILLA